MSGVDSVPFPLRYESLSTPSTAPTPMGYEDILQEEKRLAQAIKSMVHKSNSLLDKLPELRMDHIFTTNYSYYLEQAFFPHCNFGSSQIRSRFRFDLRGGESKSTQTREVQYRLHTGYFFPAGPDTPSRNRPLAYPRREQFILLPFMRSGKLWSSVDVNLLGGSEGYEASLSVPGFYTKREKAR